MKNILYIIISLIFVLPVAGFVYINNTIFQTNNTCEKYVNLQYLFHKKYINEIEEKFYLGKVKYAKITKDCNTEVYVVNKGDTIIGWHDSLEIQYQAYYADSSYVRLLMFCKKPKFQKRLFGYLKPGKIICLNSANGRLKIINLNTCANMKKFDKVLDSLKTVKKYNKIFGVRCGVSDIIEIK